MLQYLVNKSTKEGCTVGKRKDLEFKLVEEEQTKTIEVWDKDSLLYTLETIHLKRQLLCLIIDAIPTPVSFSELERFGFVHAAG